MEIAAKQFIADTVPEMGIFQTSLKSETDKWAFTLGVNQIENNNVSTQPTIITSVGGYDGPMGLASPFNIVPALELARNFKQYGARPRVIASSAYLYGVECNGADEIGSAENWSQTSAAYRQIADEFYPEVSPSLDIEVLEPAALKDYPVFLFESGDRAVKSEPSLLATAEKFGCGQEDFDRYMMSHIQAFRDYQFAPDYRFVIKVGAPSELRFSKWQKNTIDGCISAATSNGFVPNYNRNWVEYGQVTFYYPRIGNRPPYYPEINSEDAELRLRRLNQALAKTSIQPSDYFELFGRLP